VAYSKTKALDRILDMKTRVRIVQGGARAGKTIAILLILIDMAQTRDKKIISVVSETFPHLKRGALRDFLDIMKSQGYYKESQWNRTDAIYTFETGSIIEFFSADQPSKVRGPARHILFINEANNVSYETYTQLAIRTSEFIYLDYNPVAQFWVHDDIIPTQEHDFAILTYKDNEGLSPEIVKEIESRKSNKLFWKVFGEGLIGESEGKIYRDWNIIEELPHQARLERYGLDFGYSNDPTAIVAIYSFNGGYILDEIAFQKGLANKQIADILNANEKALVIADAAEPKSIDELKMYGVMVVPAKKGPGSVSQGIQYVQQQRMSMTKRSTNLIKEYRNYLWLTDREGHIINEPAHEFSHSMDAVRYGMDFLRPKPQRAQRKGSWDPHTGRRLD
jgi:phage terminase large subunit